MDYFGVPFSNIFSCFATIISGGVFLYNLYVSFPRIRVSANVETLTDFETDSDGNVYPSEGNTMLWITLSNHSPRRIYVTNLCSYWTWNLLLPFQWNKIVLDGLFRIDQERQEPVTSFWIEPWGVVNLGKSIDGFEEDFEYELKKHFTDPWEKLFHFVLSYRVVAFDGQQKRYKSNKIQIINPSIIHKNFWQILKIIFSKKK